MGLGLIGVRIRFNCLQYLLSWYCNAMIENAKIMGVAVISGDDSRYCGNISVIACNVSTNEVDMSTEN